MSYARMGVDGSEVYAYEDCRGYCVVWHEGISTKLYGGLPELRKFLLNLRARGIAIPDYTFEGIDADIRGDQEEALRKVMSDRIAVEEGDGYEHVVYPMSTAETPEHKAAQDRALARAVRKSA